MVRVLSWATGIFLEFLSRKFKSIGSVLPSFQKLLGCGELGRQEKVLENTSLVPACLLRWAFNCALEIVFGHLGRTDAQAS